VSEETAKSSPMTSFPSIMPAATMAISSSVFGNPRLQRRDTSMMPASSMQRSYISGEQTTSFPSLQRGRETDPLLSKKLPKSDGDGGGYLLIFHHCY
jgi:hypothetical protein